MDKPIEIQIDTSCGDKPSVQELYQNLLPDMEWILKLNGLTAKIKKSLYDEYVREGFSPEQAMFLIK